MNKTILFTLLIANFFLVNANTRMSAYRWRNNNGTEINATWKAPLNTSIEINNLQALRVRIAFEEYSTGSTGFISEVNAKIQFSDNSGGSWQNITIQDSPFTFAIAPDISNESFTTQQIALGDNTLFVPGFFISGDSERITSLPASANRFTELEFCLKPTTSVKKGVTYLFRVSNVGTAVNIPTLTTSADFCVTPEASVTTPQNFSSNTKILDLIVVGADIKWYAQAEGGIALDPSTVLSTGTYYVSQTVDCESLRTEVQVNVSTLAVGDHTLDQTSGFKVYPNPSSKEFSINSDSDGSAVLFDLNGKTIQSQKINSGVNTLDLGSKPNGIYLLKITNKANQSKTLKLIKN